MLLQMEEISQHHSEITETVLVADWPEYSAIIK